MAESEEVHKSMKEFITVLNSYYPETLKSFYVLGAKGLHKAIWKVVKLFISKRTQ